MALPRNPFPPQITESPMRARYVGQHAQTETFGKTFHRWKWLGIDALSDYARQTLTQNPQFETDGGEEAAVEPDPAPAEECVEA